MNANILGWIRRERVYIWMLFFIVAVNMINLSQPLNKKPYNENKGVSVKTFKDMGITEERIRAFLESDNPKAVFFKRSLITGFFIFLLGLILNLGFLIGKRRLISKLPQNKKAAPWDVSDVVRAVIIIIFVGYILGILLGLFLNIHHIKMDTNLHMMFSTFVLDIIAGFIVFYFVLIKYKENLSSIGVTFASFYKNILSGITAYISVIPILLLSLVLSILLLEMFGYKPPTQPVVEIFLQEKRSNVILFLAVFASVLGPVIEEIFFRGFLYNALKKSFDMLLAVVLSAALFSALHTNMAGFVPIMILGILMACLYEATGSLITSMAVHIIHNSITVSFVLFLKGLLK